MSHTTEAEQKVESELSAWNIVQLARHPLRPQSPDYIASLFDEPDYLYGDRAYGDDPALLSGWATFLGQPIAFLAQRKGKNLEERMHYNSGMMHPEGYRKALRVAKLAEKFKTPLVCLIDTPGAYSGVEAEKRGQSQAIAENLKIFSTLKTPIINIIIGEGCSGGALGIGVGDRLLMLEYSYFATIAPEGCASILFKSTKRAAQAAQYMGLTAKELLNHNIIDRIVPEPYQGAHLDHKSMMLTMRDVLQEELLLLQKLSVEDLLKKRYEKIMAMGEV